MFFFVCVFVPEEKNMFKYTLISTLNFFVILTVITVNVFLIHLPI